MSRPTTAVLKCEKHNIELHYEDAGEDMRSVDVHDTKRNLWGSLSLCDDQGIFHGDKPLTLGQTAFINSHAVEEWLEELDD